MVEKSVFQPSVIYIFVISSSVGDIFPNSASYLDFSPSEQFAVRTGMISFPNFNISFNFPFPLSSID